MFHAAVLFALPFVQESPTAAPLGSRIRAVDVYPSTALVVRSGELPAGDGRFVVAGLPAALVRDSVRLRAPGAEVVALELRERFERAVPAESIRGAQERLDEVRRELAAQRDEMALVEALSKHFLTLLDESAKGEAALGLSAEDRLATLALAREQLSELAAQKRQASQRWTELENERARLEADLARWQQGETVRLVDVLVDVLDTDGSADAFDLEYQVQGAHWEPVYDLRASADLTAVELVHRARIHQMTGEDWSGVELALSTARPRRGLSAPEPGIRWVDLWENTLSVAHDMAPAAEAMEMERGFAASKSEPGGGGLQGGLSDDARRAATGRWAAIAADGVNLRYALPRPQDVPSRPEPTAVLVGRADLDVELERVCIPSLDPTVWLRGRARNTTPWVLLEGEASVHVGSNFLGTTPLARVQTGAEFDLPLGEDPTVTVERVQIEDTQEQPGLFGSKVRAFESFRYAVANQGTAPVKVLLHESLPRARDGRIDVGIDKAQPAVATGERWRTLREERGLLTWELDLAAGAERTVDLRLSFAYPQKATLVRE